MAGLISLGHLCQALALTNFDAAASRQRMTPVPRGWQKWSAPPKLAAVAILVYPAAEAGLSIVLTLRNPDLRGHSGQVSFPGGRQDANDDSLAATALRETCEEIGVCEPLISILGWLPRLYIPASHYDVYAMVAAIEGAPVFAPNPDEVAQVFDFALDDLLQAQFKGSEERQIRGYDVKAPYYAVKGHKVWGATAIMLSELEERLRRVLPRSVTQELG